MKNNATVIAKIMGKYPYSMQSFLPLNQLFFPSYTSLFNKNWSFLVGHSLILIVVPFGVEITNGLGLIEQCDLVVMLLFLTNVRKPCLRRLCGVWGCSLLSNEQVTS